jgi:hypothetical protein
MKKGEQGLSVSKTGPAAGPQRWRHLQEKGPQPSDFLDPERLPMSLQLDLDIFPDLWSKLRGPGRDFNRVP